MLLHRACTQNSSRCARKAVKAVYLFLLGYKRVEGTFVFYLEGNSEMKQRRSQEF